MTPPLFATIEQISGKSFDVVIVGGGTAGCTLAARLTEKSNISVLVLEAGPVHMNDASIDIPAVHFEQLLNPNYDWIFPTTPERNHMQGRGMWNRGKGLGGTSNMNAMMWTRPGKEEMDAWEQLGNPGWNYDGFIPYIKRAERFHPPTEMTIKRELLAVDSNWFGKDGPIDISYPESSTNAGPVIRDTMRNLGIPLTNDPVNGQYRGTWIAPNTLDPKSLSRSTAFKGYLLPNLGRENLFVLPNAFVTKLLFNETAGGPITAKGVEFRYENQIHIVKAAKEVIISAGTLKTPQILELSGIGDPSVLEPVGIPVHVNLPGVGANLQEHGGDGSICFEIRPDSGIQSLDRLSSDSSFAAEQLKLYQAKKPGSLLACTLGGATFLSLKDLFGDAAEKIITRHEQYLRENPPKSEGLKDQYEFQLKRLRNQKLSVLEIIPNPSIPGGKWSDRAEPGKSYVSIFILLNNPFSRGAMHITTSDPFATSRIEPRDLDFQIDRDIMLQGFKFVRALANYEPFKAAVAKEVSPGPAVSSDEDINQHLKDNFCTFWHTVGTASMLPRDKGGVVDSKLKVYGTTNVRVVDISIVPLHVSVHTQCMAYGIGEKAADIILEELV